MSTVPPPGPPGPPPCAPGPTTLTLFLAQAVALETDVAAQYGRLAQEAAARGDAEVAALFDDLGYQSRKHAADVRTVAERHGGLPEIAAWESPWHALGDPARTARPTTDLPPADPPDTATALRFALACEERARAFYLATADDTPDPEVARLAQQFAAEEDTHVALIRQWIGGDAPPAG